MIGGMDRRRKTKVAFFICGLTAMILGFIGVDSSRDVLHLAMVIVAWGLSMAGLLIFAFGRLWKS